MNRFPLFVFCLLFSVSLLALPGPLAAQDEQEDPPVQVLTERLFEGEQHRYRLPGLKQGDTLYVSMSNVSGNLDPLLLLTTPDGISDALLEEMRAELAARVAAGDDEVLATVEILAENFLAGNDNYEADSTAAFAYTIPMDGDYLLLALGGITNQTAGEYELRLGINAPLVLEGQGQDTGAEIAILNKETSGISKAVQEVFKELTAEQSLWIYTIPHLEEGDTLYASVETISGDLVPVLTLEDYGGRTVRLDNSTGAEQNASFEYPVQNLTDNFRIVITAWGDEETQTTGEYRLLVGRNAPDVLSGEAQSMGRKLLSGQEPVTVSVELQQITGVDQKAENYGGVYSMSLKWHDPTRAFNPDDCKCSFQTFVGPSFTKLIGDENLVWPSFTIYNQQNNRWIQAQGIINEANGDMTYFERFTTTLQAPDFNFRAFPFDTQQFYLHIDSLYPQTFYQFVGPPELSTVGDQLGEEEWQVSEHTTEVTDIPSLGYLPSSRFSFGFTARRHLNFYIMRIFLPTLLIIIVSYFTFFLKDYGKRIEAASANLLVFVAFNFTISGELPRLGYLTFLDAVLASVFIVTALVVAFNVYLKRLELNGKEARARKIDSYTLWVYPLLYAVGAVVLYVYFILPQYWDVGAATVLQWLNRI
jgi:Neurotransmitter-gated ion-channel ligand binding domain